jgi:glutamine synthetase
MELHEVEGFLDAAGVTTVEIAATDLVGALRGKRVSVPMFLEVAERGVGVCNAMLAWDIRAELFETSLANWRTGFPDVHLCPDLDTLRLAPWRPHTAIVMADVVDHARRPLDIHPRAVLGNVVEVIRGMGYEPRVGPELEFFLLDRDTRAPVGRSIPCYSLYEASEFEPVIRDLRTAMDAAGITIEASNAEYAPGQFEVNIRYDDPVTAADATILFRYAAKQIASDHGLLATFMAKPFNDFSGNGMHIHHSLWRSGGENLFHDRNGESEFSASGRSFAAGLLHWICDFSSLGSSNPNAYKRRQPYSFAPVNVSWGHDNRTAAVRLIAGGPRGTRVEQRDAAADANPYLAIAAQLWAGMQGIKQDLQLPDPASNAYEDGSATMLPGSFREAITAFEQSKAACAAFGAGFVDLYLDLLRNELRLCDSAVTDWEFQRYLDVS